MPTLRASKSPSPSTLSTDSGAIDVPFTAGAVGDAGLVGGSEAISMSIIIEARLRNAGSSANRVVIGLGGGRIRADVSRGATDGRWKDQPRTIFNANA